MKVAVPGVPEDSACILSDCFPEMPLIVRALTCIRFHVCPLQTLSKWAPNFSIDGCITEAQKN